MFKALNIWRKRQQAHQARLLDRAVQACSDHDLESLETCLDDGLDVDANLRMGQRLVEAGARF